MRGGIAIAVGGTGGHLFPAMSLAKQLSQLRPHLPILFIGAGLKKNPYFQQDSFPFIEVKSAAPFGGGVRKLLFSVPSLSSGVWSSAKALRASQPDLVVGFGSFHAFPPLVAATLMGLPLILHESNAIPGKVNRLFAGRALFTAIHFCQAAKHLKGKTALVGMPLRESCFQEISENEALNYFGLKPNRQTILIFGGSQGAVALNSIFMKAAMFLSSAAKRQLQFLHFTGSEKEKERVELCYQTCGVTACVKAFESQMAYAWKVADLLVSRSGAGTISEQFHFAVPALFVPYPYASDGHQEKNARYVAEQVKGAEVVLEKDLKADRLAQKLNDFIGVEREVWQKRKEALIAHRDHLPQAELATLISDLLDRGV